jgi:transposase
VSSQFCVEEGALIRQQKTRPIYDELLSWCRTCQPHEPPKTPLAAACAYLINHCDALMRFLDDGAFPIDNGLVERLHRRPAIGRHNFLFVGSHAGGERAAIAYSILGTCRLLGINPVAYLANIVPTRARGNERDDITALMPKSWLLAHLKPPRLRFDSQAPRVFYAPTAWSCTSPDLRPGESDQPRSPVLCHN